MPRLLKFRHLANRIITLFTFYFLIWRTGTYFKFICKEVYGPPGKEVIPLVTIQYTQKMPFISEQPLMIFEDSYESRIYWVLRLAQALKIKYKYQRIPVLIKAQGYKSFRGII